MVCLTGGKEDSGVWQELGSLEEKVRNH
jgi:hypothetical protein